MQFQIFKIDNSVDHKTEEEQETSKIRTRNRSIR